MGTVWRRCLECRKWRTRPIGDTCRRCHGHKLLAQLDGVIARGHGSGTGKAIEHSMCKVTDATCWVCSESEKAKARQAALLEKETA